MKSLFYDLKRTKKIKLGSILGKIIQHQNRGDQSDLDGCHSEICTSTQFLQMQMKQLIDLQEHLERYFNALPVFGFNSAKYDPNLIKSYLLPVVVNEGNIKPTVIKKWTSLPCSNSVILSCWILWIFLQAQQILISLEGIQNSRDKKILPLRIVWSPRQNAIDRTSTVWCFLQ